ncbi:MAG: peptide chain release factor 1 [Acidimicrobiales bacterium]|nr:peptide chain release factor 1 [Acidimicrobiales bacterium]
MSDRVDHLVQEYADTQARLADPTVVADQARYTALARRFKELEPIVACIEARAAALDDAAAARELLAEADGDDAVLLRDEIAQAEATAAAKADELRVLLLPKDPNDERAVIMEIRGAEGGEEANLFARDLFEMYRAFAARKGWRLEVLGSSPSDLGGFNDVTFRVAGDAAWSHLHHEGGPHRVQRVPVTESQGRIHTSSATVSVLPEADEVEVAIDPADLEVATFRATGPGGQSVNTTDSAVRVTHKPTGLVVSMQDEKSQLQNKAKALTVLRARLLQLEQDRRSAELSAERKGQIGGGGRSEKIRTYNFKENRVTDHRIGLTLHKLDRVLGGELDEIVDALIAHERAELLAAEA